MPLTWESNSMITEELIKSFNLGSLQFLKKKNHFDYDYYANSKSLTIDLFNNLNLPYLIEIYKFKYLSKKENYYEFIIGNDEIADLLFENCILKLIKLTNENIVISITEGGSLYFRVSNINGFSLHIEAFVQPLEKNYPVFYSIFKDKKLVESDKGSLNSAFSKIYKFFGMSEEEPNTLNYNINHHLTTAF